MAEGDIYRCDINWTMQNNPNVNCYLFKSLLEEAGPKPEEQLLVEFNASWFPDFEDMTNDSAIVECTVCQRIIPTPGLPFIVPQGNPCDRLGLALPGNVQAVVQLMKDDDTTAPRERGRDFIGGSNEADQVDGIWTQAYANLVLNFYNTTLLAGLVTTEGSSFEWGLYSATQAAENVNPIYVSNGGSTPDPPTFGNNPWTPITYVQMNPKCRTQRRREAQDPCSVPLVDETV